MGKTVESQMEIKPAKIDGIVLGCFVNWVTEKGHWVPCVVYWAISQSMGSWSKSCKRPQMCVFLKKLLSDHITINFCTCQDNASPMPYTQLYPGWTIKHENKSKTHFHKIYVMSSWTVCELWPWLLKTLIGNTFVPHYRRRDAISFRVTELGM